MTETAMSDITKSNIEPNQTLINPPTTPITKPLSKPWWQSKTIGFNSLVMVATLVTAATPALEQYMNEDSYAVLMAVVTLGNTILRLFTNKPLTKGKPTSPDSDSEDDSQTEDTQ